MAWYGLEKKEVLRELGVTEAGLSQKHAEERLEVYGKNATTETEQQGYFSLLIDQFTSFLPWLLISMGLLALAAHYFMGLHEHLFDALIIFSIVIINASLVAYQEYHSRRDAHKLEAVHESDCPVLRNGRTRSVHAWSVVPGDVLLLSKGMRVPADAYLLSSNSLEADESSLTGESLPVAKKPGVIKGEAAIDEQHNMLFRNTFITNGTAKAVVVATGASTQMGLLTKNIRRKRKSPFIEELDAATNRITLIAISLCVLIVLLFVAQGFTWTTILLMAAALLIGAIPESLPAIVSFSITASHKRLLKKNVLAKRRTLIETLGSIDVICVDKTGTLTTNKLTLKELFIDGQTSLSTLSDKAKEHFTNASLLANAASMSPQGYVGDDIDIAFIDYFNDQGYDLLAYYDENQRQSIKPFSTLTRSISASIRRDNKKYTYTKGSPEHLLKRCNKAFSNGKAVAMTKKRLAMFNEKIASFTKQSLKPIGLSYRQGKDEVFLGIVGLYDPPRTGLEELIATLEEAGITIKMITGDHQETALSVAKSCGFNNPRAIDWEELKDLSANQLNDVVKEYDVFTRMNPEHKLMIVKALQENGYRVAISGDGINDVPAFQQAEVGIAVGEHSDAMAKDAADLIITDDHLESIVDGVREGRTIFYNVRKVINYLFTANLGEILVVMIGSFFSLMPFLPIQLLWANFVANHAPALALGVDEPPKDIMQRQPTGKREHFVTRKLSALAVYISLKKVILLSLLFYGAYTLTGNLVLAQTLAFTWLILWHFVRVITIKMDEHQPLTNNHLLIAALTLPLALQLVILYTPLGAFFRVVPLTLAHWSVLIVAMLIAISLERYIALFVEKKVKHEAGDY